jgi:ribosomal protein L44E
MKHIGYSGKIRLYYMHKHTHTYTHAHICTHKHTAKTTKQVVLRLECVEKENRELNDYQLLRNGNFVN